MKTTRKILFSIVLLFILTNSYSQLKFNISVFKDSALNTYLLNVKVKVISIDKKEKCFKIKHKGKYEILIKNPKSIYSIKIFKKHYIPIIIKKVKSERKNEYNIKVILRKALSVHDKDYDGPSKLVSIKKLE